VSLLKKAVSHLPRTWQHELRRQHFAHQLRSGRFRTDEKEYDVLEQFVSLGDWVVDVGANVGHYTNKLSGIVGPTGRVIAFEPVPATFEILASNARLFPFANVTLLNLAAGKSTCIAGMEIPKFESGLDNYYMAHLLTGGVSGLEVMCIPIDCLSFPSRICLVKIDAEGVDLAVLHGMERLLANDHPIVIIEDDSNEIDELLLPLGYVTASIPGSHNRVFTAH